MEPLILGTAFVFGYLAYRLGLPPLVGFLLAGLSLSAYGIEAPAWLSLISDVGVTLLLFTIGLKLKVKNLLRPEVWAGGSLHMALTVALFGFLLFCLGYTGLRAFAGLDLATAILLAFALSFSSTVFAVKILDENGRMDSLNGRTAVGVLIIQDVLAVVYLTISTGKLPSVWALLVIGLLPLARWVFQRLLNRMGHGELMVLFGLFLALVAGAYAFERVHLKPDLGALLVGMLLAPHLKARELADGLMSIKDLLLVGFFLQIGLTGLPDQAGWVAVSVLVLMLPLKLLLYYTIFTRFTLTARTSLRATLNLANYSEFGLIVGSMAVSVGQIDAKWLVVFAIALSVSFMIASPLNRQADHLFEAFGPFFKRFETSHRHPEEVPFKPEPWEVVVLGMGRVGSGAYDWFRDRFEEAVVGFDFNPDIVSRNLADGRRVIAGDVTDPDFWRRMPICLASARLVVLAMPGVDCMQTACGLLREARYAGKIAAVAYFDDDVETLRQAGVDTAFNIFSEAGAGLAAHTCGALGPFKSDPGESGTAIQDSAAGSLKKI